MDADPKAAVPNPDDEAPSRRRGIGLCLSGGGFRATLFHLGAIQRLFELGIATRPDFDTVSSVSGGSLTSAQWAIAQAKANSTRLREERDVSPPQDRHRGYAAIRTHAPEVIAMDAAFTLPFLEFAGPSTVESRRVGPRPIAFMLQPMPPDPATAEGSDRLAETLTLSKGIITDLETQGFDIDVVLRKAARLAALVDSSPAVGWLACETNGYFYIADHQNWSRAFGRGMTVSTELTEYRPGELEPLAVLEAERIELRDRCQHPGANVHQREWWMRRVRVLETIRTKVVRAVHSFAVGVYHRAAFANVAEGIFESHRRSVEALLRELAPDALEKIPAIADRLRAGDPEAVTHALTTIRRIITALADRVFPPQPEPVVRDGTTYVVDAEKDVNRLTVFMLDAGISADRRKRIRDAITGIRGRASAGVHDEVSVEEAHALFLWTYMLAGEILSLVPRGVPAA